LFALLRRKRIERTWPQHPEVPPAGLQALARLAGKIRQIKRFTRFAEGAANRRTESLVPIGSLEERREEGRVLTIVGEY
jgi:hypothetical protein